MSRLGAGQMHWESAEGTCAFICSEDHNVREAVRSMAGEVFHGPSCLSSLGPSPVWYRSRNDKRRALDLHPRIPLTSPIQGVFHLNHESIRLLFIDAILPSLNGPTNPAVPTTLITRQPSSVPNLDRILLSHAPTKRLCRGVVHRPRTRQEASFRQGRDSGPGRLLRTYVTTSPR